MADWRSIPEIYPFEVTLKHHDRIYDVSLAVVKWLESNKIMNIVDFHLEMNFEVDRIAVLFKKKKLSGIEIKVPNKMLYLEMVRS